MLKRPRTVVLFGGPGSGKGTQARLLEIPHISSGDLIRQEQADVAVSGNLAEDGPMSHLVWRAVTPYLEKGFILDGYPRTVVQARILDDWAEAQCVPGLLIVSFDVPQDILRVRLTGRRYCGSCGRSCHLEFNPPKIAGKCDHCAGSLLRREDDHPDIVETRLGKFARETAPVFDHYAGRPHFHRLDGREHPETIALAIRSIVASES